MENISVFLRIKPSFSNSTFEINPEENTKLKNLKTNEIYSFGKKILIKNIIKKYR